MVVHVNHRTRESKWELKSRTPPLVKSKDCGLLSSWSRECLFLIHTNVFYGLVALTGIWPNSFSI